MLQLNLMRMFSGQTSVGVSTLGLPTLGPEVSLSLYIYIHIYICICVCVSMCVSILA